MQVRTVIHRDQDRPYSYTKTDGFHTTTDGYCCNVAALGDDPMKEAALLVEKAQEEVAAMPEEAPRIKTRGRIKEGEEDKPRVLFNARSKVGRVKCDGYFTTFLDGLRVEALVEADNGAEWFLKHKA